MSIQTRSIALSNSQKEKLRVLHLDHSAEAGGAELALLRILVKSFGWKAALRVPHHTDGKSSVFSALAQNPAVQFNEVGRPQRPGATSRGQTVVSLTRFAADALIEAARLRFSHAFNDADVIHANTSRSAVYGAVASIFSRKTLVVHLRDMTNAESLGPVGFRLFSGLALKRANGVIANSRATLASALPYISNRVATSVIPSPIGFDERKPLAPVNLHVSSIGMVARIDDWKGHALLIEAFSRACPSGPVRLVLAGGTAFDKGADLDELKLIAVQFGVGDRVDFLGHVRNIPELIESFDICVQASTRPEPLGQNVLQYLASGKPIIAVNAGGPAEWITDGVNGALFEMNSVNGLTKALGDLVNDVALRERLARGALGTRGIGTDAEVAYAHAAAFETAFVLRHSRTRRTGRLSDRAFS